MRTSFRFIALCLFVLVLAQLKIHAQDPSCPHEDQNCVRTLSLSPGTIVANNVQSATGTATWQIPTGGQHGPILLGIAIGSFTGGFVCPAPSFAFSDGINRGCELPQCPGPNTNLCYPGTLTQQFYVHGSVAGTYTVQAFPPYGTNPTVTQPLTLTPVQPQQPVGPDTPDPLPDCNGQPSGPDNGGGDGNAPNDGIDPSQGCEASGPINLANGNTYIRQNDYSLPGGRGGLSLSRTWNSMWAALRGADSGAPPQSGMFGNGWTSTYEQRINIHTVNGGTNGRKVWLSSGNSSFFSYNMTLGVWMPAYPLTLHSSLTYDPISNTYTYTNHNGTKQKFNQAGNLINLIDRNNNQTTLCYGPNCFAPPDHPLCPVGQNLTQVTDQVGRWIRFEYCDANNPNQVTRVYDVTNDPNSQTDGIAVINTARISLRPPG